MANGLLLHRSRYDAWCGYEVIARLAQDRAASLALQDRCLRESPTARVDALDTSHSANCSQPDRLVRSIVELSLS